MRQGNYSVVEIAMQRNQDFAKLSFLYAVAGETEKLGKMLKISEIRGDVMSWYHNALYLGDKAAQVRALAQTGQLPLAFLCAQRHGLAELAVELRQSLSAEGEFALLCFALLLCLALLCFVALLCFALLCFALLCFALLCFALLCFALLGLSSP